MKKISSREDNEIDDRSIYIVFEMFVFQIIRSLIFLKTIPNMVSSKIQKVWAHLKSILKRYFGKAL